jgi:hypothetical protein
MNMRVDRCALRRTLADGIDYALSFGMFAEQPKGCWQIPATQVSICLWASLQLSLPPQRTPQSETCFHGQRRMNRKSP